MTSGQTASNGAVEQAFRALESAWDDDAAHRRFIAFCSARGQLAEAGRLYRDVRDRDPARRDEATRRLAAILGAAFATLDASRLGMPRKRARTAHVVLVGVVLGVIAAVLLAVLRRFGAFR